MFDPERLLGQMLMGGVTGGRPRRGRGLAGGLRGGLGRAATSAQGLTLLAGLAVAAYEHLQDKRAAGAPAPAGPSAAGGPAAGSAGGPAAPPPLPPEAMGGPGAAPPAGPAGAASGTVRDDAARARLLLEAMVDAAKADGVIDAAERQRILARVDEQGDGTAARAWLEAELARPMALDSIAARAAGDPQLAAQVYAAASLAIDCDTPAERAYLAMLSARLGLAEDVVAELEQRTAALRGPAGAV